MFEFTKSEINKIADDSKFNRNTTEKVLRLFDVLKFINDGELRNCLTLKGGTAINLFLLNLPRLSVDIDLDFNERVSKDEMFSLREKIDKMIKDFMSSEGYI